MASTRPPRRLTDRIIDARMWAGIVWGGLVMATVTLVALDLRLEGGIFGGSGGIEEARTMAFTTLVLAQLFNCFNARSDTTSAFHQFFTNCLLWAAIAFSVLIQIAVVHVSILNDAFNTTPLSAGDWLLCTALASIVLWADEAKKLLECLLHPPAGSTHRCLRAGSPAAGAAGGPLGAAPPSAACSWLLSCDQPRGRSQSSHHFCPLGVQLLVEGHDRPDESEVGEGLREVADLLPGGVDLLGIEAEVVPVGQHLRERQARVVEPARAGERIDIEERAQGEGALRAREAIG